MKEGRAGEVETAGAEDTDGTLEVLAWEEDADKEPACM